VSEQPALQAVKALAKPLIRKKIAGHSSTHHEHEPKWEIPINGKTTPVWMVLDHHANRGLELGEWLRQPN
jgi:hypothetical protein